MKKTFLCLLLLFTLAYCKTKKKTAATPAKPAAGKMSPLEIAKKRWSGTTQAQLQEGKTIFETKCTTCHEQKNIVTRSEESWIKSIDKMAPKAKLTAAEKEKLTRYILSFREAYTTTD